VADTDDDDRLLLTVEAAEYLRCSPRTLEGFRVDGTGPAYSKLGPGRRAPVLYRLGDLKAYVKRHRVEPGQKPDDGKGPKP
jgi:hypothetical protein